jgi:hypothetical protein
MTPSVPLQFLVGLTRLIAIYFGLRSLEALAGSITTYVMQRSASPKIAAMMPSAWALYVPLFCFCVFLVLLAWFAAPAICRLAARPRKTDLQESSESGANWNEVMIFLVGTLFVGWEIAHLVDVIAPMLQSNARQLPRPFRLIDSLDFFTNAILIGFGAILMGRFSAIHRWINRRSNSRETSAGE